MMLQGGPPGLSANNPDDNSPASAPQPQHDNPGAELAGSGGSGFSEDERGGRTNDGGRNSGGNRWPRQETLTLLKIPTTTTSATANSAPTSRCFEAGASLTNAEYSRYADVFVHDNGVCLAWTECTKAFKKVTTSRRLRMKELLLSKGRSANNP
nr:hypothetical protein [Tanacetum cinerariifolium]